MFRHSTSKWIMLHWHMVLICNGVIREKLWSGLKRQTILIRPSEPERGSAAEESGTVGPVTRLSERMAIVTMKYGWLAVDFDLVENRWHCEQCPHEQVNISRKMPELGWISSKHLCVNCEIHGTYWSIIFPEIEWRRILLYATREGGAQSFTLSKHT